MFSACTKNINKPKLTEIISKLSPNNFDNLLNYANTLNNIQENTVSKERRWYNHRNNVNRFDKEKLWNYMTEDIINNHKNTHEKSNSGILPEFDIIYRSRFSNVQIIDIYKFIDVFGKKHNKVIMADYLMFNPHFKLDYQLVDRLLPYCKIKNVDEFTYNVDGWIITSCFYGTPSYKISYDNSDYDNMKFISTDEEKRLAVRLFLQVMNETPEEYVNLQNYNVIGEWYYNNDSYINSYEKNEYSYACFLKNKHTEHGEFTTEELIIPVENKATTAEIIKILSENVKYGKNDMNEMGLTITVNVQEQPEFVMRCSGNSDNATNIECLDLNKYYQKNGYSATENVINSITHLIKYRINCYNYPKENGNKITLEELIIALYNSCCPYGMGILHGDNKSLTVPEAKKLIAGKWIDYYKGVAMKLHCDRGTFPIMDFQRFEKYNGTGKFMQCIKQLQKMK